jgi:hypothetical protein
MRPNLPFVSAKHTLVTYNITLSLITKTKQGPRCFQEAIREGKSCLLSGGAPDSPVHHRTSPVHCPVQIAFLNWRSRLLKTWSRWRTGHRPVHTGQFGAPIRPLARPRVTRGLRGRPLARPTVGSPDSPVHHRTVR